jgi:acetyltransferase-like isoleucine patch superfamily enzyme
MRNTASLPRRVLRILLRPVVLDILNRDMRIWGDPARVKIAKSAHMMNTLFNVISGTITIGEATFAGHNVMIITGAHDYDKLMEERMWDVPREGRDIRIGKGVWIGSNAVILGPCNIGDHAVIAAGAVVINDVPPRCIVGGIPARTLRTLAEPAQP